MKDIKDKGVMFSCELCHKQYAYIHKLEYHKVWQCKGLPSESCMLTSPRRKGSNNCYVLPPTPAKGEGDTELVELVEEQKARNEHVLIECVEGGVEEVFTCDICGESLSSKNSRKKHKRKKHRQHLQEVGRPKFRLFKDLLLHDTYI